MNANITVKKKEKFNGEIVGDIEVESSNLVATVVNKSIVPRLIDEYPILFVAASFASGISEFYGLKELKVKESNRLSSMSNALSKNGVKLELGNDSIKSSEKKLKKEEIMLKQKMITE